jgi:hypothetical protein
MKEPPSAEQWSAGRNNKSTYLAYEENPPETFTRGRLRYAKEHCDRGASYASH